MAMSLERRLQKDGVTNTEAKKFILQQGLLRFCNEQNCGIESGRRYAENTLGLKDFELVSKRSLQTKHDVARELLFAMFKKWKELEEENTQLKEELANMQDIEDKKEALAKAQLIEMLEAVNL